MTKQIEAQNPKIHPIPELLEEKKLLPLLPLKNVVLLPKSIIPIIVGRQSSVHAVEYALKHNRTIFITASKVYCGGYQTHEMR